jgi:outer membrane protein assembly factor BamA
MSGRIAFLLFTLSLSVYSCAQEGADERGWTDKNNTEMYAAYMLQHSYNEQGYWGAKVETRQSGTKRVFVVEPGRIYHVKHFDVSGLSGLPEDAMKDSPRAGDLYSPNRVNEWIASIEKRDARRGNWGAQFDQVHAQVKIEVKFMEVGLKPSPNNPRP